MGQVKCQAPHTTSGEEVWRARDQRELFRLLGPPQSISVAGHVFAHTHYSVSCGVRLWAARPMFTLTPGGVEGEGGGGVPGSSARENNSPYRLSCFTRTFQAYFNESTMPVCVWVCVCYENYKWNMMTLQGHILLQSSKIACPRSRWLRGQNVGVVNFYAYTCFCEYIRENEKFFPVDFGPKKIFVKVYQISWHCPFKNKTKEFRWTSKVVNKFVLYPCLYGLLYSVI